VNVAEAPPPDFRQFVRPQLGEDIADQLRRLACGEGTKLADDAAMEAFLAEIEAEVQDEIARGDHCHE
jgi:hypothetical protein